jgi:hypothetical protein
MVVVAVAIVVGHHDAQNRWSTARRVLARPCLPCPQGIGGATAWGKPYPRVQHLRPGSNPAVLPGPVLIADRDNNRPLEVSPDGQLLWRFPASGDLAPGQTFLLPDDAFFSPSGRQVVVTQAAARGDGLPPLELPCGGVGVGHHVGHGHEQAPPADVVQVVEHRVIGVRVESWRGRSCRGG